MRIAALVLGIVGGAIGLLGGLFTMGFGSIGKSLNAKDTDVNQVMSLGAVAMLVSFFALLVSCFMNKSPKAISVFLLIAGVVCIVCANWFSGIIIALGGIFGLLSMKKVS
jgi:uncharacterized membrane protein